MEGRARGCACQEGTLGESGQLSSEPPLAPRAHGPTGPTGPLAPAQATALIPRVGQLRIASCINTVCTPYIRSFPIGSTVAWARLIRVWPTYFCPCQGTTVHPGCACHLLFPHAFPGIILSLAELTFPRFLSHNTFPHVSILWTIASLVLPMRPCSPGHVQGCSGPPLP